MKKKSIKCMYKIVTKFIKGPEIVDKYRNIASKKY